MKKMLILTIVAAILFTVCSCTVIDRSNTFCLASDGQSSYTIFADNPDDDNIQLAVNLLKNYIDGVSGADISISEGEKTISFITDKALAAGAYSVAVDRCGSVVIKAADGIALYYASYDLCMFLRKTTKGHSVYIGADTLLSGKTDNIDNSGLIPEYKTPDQTTLVTSNRASAAYCPDWIAGLTIAEIRIETATTEGTLEAAVSVLDRLTEVGVNAVWVCPIYDGEYGNKGPQSVNPKITGTDDYDVGRQRVCEFVKAAHERNIYVFLDIITWGVWTNSPLVSEHPDWFSGIGMWGGYDYNWDNAELREWFICEAVSIIEKTGADGFRCDLEPGQTGYEVFREIRSRLYEKGFKTAFFSEGTNKRDGVYDFEQNGARTNYGEYLSNPAKPYFVKSIEAQISLNRIINGSTNPRFTTYCLSNHDFTKTAVNKNRLIFGYSAVFTPHIPLWFLGEEYGIYAEGTLYYSAKQDLSLLENAEVYMFYNDVKKYISIKYTYPDLFCSFSERFSKNNICDVAATGCGEDITAYARYGKDRCIIVVPNADEGNVRGKISVNVSFADFGFTPENIRVTDLLTDEVLYEGAASGFTEFDTYVMYEHIGVYLFEAC